MARRKGYFTKAYNTIIQDAPAIWLAEPRPTVGYQGRIELTTLRCGCVVGAHFGMVDTARQVDRTRQPARRAVRQSTGGAEDSVAGDPLHRAAPAQAAVIVAIVGAITFVLIHIAPGDPFSAVLDNPNVEADYARHFGLKYGLDRPLPEQFVRYAAARPWRAGLVVLPIVRNSRCSAPPLPTRCC
jgi:hypothetical protein